jgi:hypothetical protein
LTTFKVRPETPLLPETFVTVPEPVGTAHVPSPRQKVPEEAFVPELKRATGRFPVRSVEASIDACVEITPPVALTHPLEVNLPICLPVVFEKIAACPDVEVDVSLVTSPEPPPPLSAPTVHDQMKVDAPVWRRTA